MPVPAFVGPLPKCKIEGCDRISRYVTVHLCGRHEMRIRRYGDPNHVTAHDDWKKKCSDAHQGKPAKSTSYRKRFGRHAHRIAAEQKIGRQLLPGEIVHHIDGNKHNNHPDNLEVMTQAEHIRTHHAEMMAARKAKHA